MKIIRPRQSGNNWTIFHVFIPLINWICGPLLTCCIKTIFIIRFYSVVTRMPRCEHLGSPLSTEQFIDQCTYLYCIELCDRARRRVATHDSLVPTDCCVAYCLHCVLGRESCRITDTIILGLTHIIVNIIRVTKE